MIIQDDKFLRLTFDYTNNQLTVYYKGQVLERTGEILTDEQAFRIIHSAYGQCYESKRLEVNPYSWIERIFFGRMIGATY